MTFANKLLAGVCTLAILLPQAVPVVAETQDFDDYLFQVWKDEIERDYTLYHDTVIHPENYGLSKPEVTLGHITLQDYEDSVIEAQEYLSELEQFDYNKLTDSQKIDYDVLFRSFSLISKLNQYPMFDEYFNPYSGAVSNYQTYFTEYRFYKAEDFEDYLTLLADYPRLMDEMMEFTKYQASNGFFMSDTTCDDAIQELNDFTAKTEDNPFIIIFNENVDSYDGLSDSVKSDLKQRNRDILIQQILPKYNECADELEKLKGSRSTELGVCGYENGYEYYEAFAQYQTSTNLSVEEMLTFIQSNTINALNCMYGYLDTNAKKPGNVYREPSELSFTDPNEVLEYLRLHMNEMPVGPEVDFKTSYLDQSVANPSTVAYYVSPAIDDIRDNIIRINGESVKDNANTLYATLSHEGFPGHLFQFTYFFNTNPALIRTSLSFLGYTEGWAQYVEGMMLEVSGLDEYSAMYEELNTYVGYCTNAIWDLGVNGLGWTVDDLASMGYDKETAKDIFDSVQGMPGMILPYGFGIAKFQNLRDKAMIGLGEKFNPVEYHKVILDNGPRTMEMLEQDIDSYIIANGGTLPKSWSAYEVKAKEKGFENYLYRDDMDEPSTTNPETDYVPVIIGGIAAVALLIIVLLNRKRKKLQEKVQQDVLERAREQREMISGHVHTETESSSMEDEPISNSVSDKTSE